MSRALFLLLAGCPWIPGLDHEQALRSPDSVPTDSEADSDVDADTDTDADADADADADTDVDDTTLIVSAKSVTTREAVSFQMFMNYGSDDEQDVTADTVFVSSDPNLLEFYEHAVGQPIDAGSVTVTATYAKAWEESADIDISLATPEPGDLVFNEILADGTVDGDPNADKSTDAVEDEFVEIANLADATLDLEGVLIVDSDNGIYSPRHTFGEGITIKPGWAVVVFGGGDATALDDTLNAQFFVAENDDPGIAYGLGLQDEGETIRLVAADGKTELTSVSYGSASTDGSVPAASDESIVLEPEVTGSSYVEHSAAKGASGMFSPGTYVDGANFPGPEGVFGK